MKQIFNIHVIVDQNQNSNFENLVMIDFDLGIISLDLIFNSFLAYQEFSKCKSIVFNYDESFNKSIYQYRKNYEALTNRVFGIEKKINSDFLNFVKLVNGLKISLDFKSLDSFSFQYMPTDPLIYINTSQLSLKEILKLLKNENIGKNCVFYDKYNEGKYLSYEDMLLMYQKIGSIVKDIENKSLSPLELVYYIYDIVRERIYHVEDDDEDYTKSRNLANILEGEDIVCLGFSNLFSAICDYFGINSEIIYWSNENNSEHGHASNLVFINDEKYNIHNIFTMDTTWDSKKNMNDSSYINSCNHAFIPFNAECTLKQKHNLNNPHGICFNLIETRYERYNTLLELNAPTVILIKEIEILIKGINIYYAFLGIKKINVDILLLLSNPSFVKNIYEEFLSLKKPFLNFETFLDIINIIRALEIEKEPEKFDNTITGNDIIKTNAGYKCMLDFMNFREIVFGKSRTKKKPTN